MQALCLLKSEEGLAKVMTAIHCDRFRSSGYHRVRNEGGDHAASDTAPGAPDPTACHRSGGPAVQIDDAVFIPGRSCRRKRRQYTRDQTTNPTRTGMLKSAQARTVRHGGCPVHSNCAHAKRLGDGYPVVRVCGVDSWPGALSLSSGWHTTASSYGSLASSAYNLPNNLMPYAKALKKAQCESIETSFRKRRLPFAGPVKWKTNERLGRRVMFGARWLAGRIRDQVEINVLGPMSSRRPQEVHA